MDDKHQDTFKHLLNETMLSKQILGNIQIDNIKQQYPDDRMLIKYGYCVYSQSDEDGIINEIFNRIGTKSKVFIEFGVGNGLENNTTYLLTTGWTGLWIEANEKNCTRIKNTFSNALEAQKLKLIESKINAENICGLIQAGDLQKPVDLLSIDIDGNDYHILNTIDNINPRVIVIEYNALMGKDTEWVMEYNPDHTWEGSIYHGATLKSITKLANNLGYILVGCNLTGVNAFFVREDLINDKFTSNFTSEYHYMENRTYLISSYKANYKKSPQLFICENK
ncbi:MAG: hypothetical protein C0603_09770 [Denitrovibrio sp.]|nr:MAG: hypothetical protein C0603_09770 [Denitrovibrio sp.]